MKNIELEKSYLGNLLQGQKQGISLKPEDFYDSNHRILFEILLQFKEFTLIQNEFGKKIKNASDYLADFFDVPFILDMKSVAKTIKSMSIKRQVINRFEEYKSDKIDLFTLIAVISQAANIEQSFTPKPINLLQGEGIKFNLYFPEGEISIIAGNGGVGKTYMAIYLALKYCRDANKKALLWLTEDGEGQLKYRVNQLSRFYQLPVSNNLSVELSAPRPLMEKQFGNIKKTSDFKRTLDYILNFDLIILDPLVNFNPFDVNDNQANRVFLNAVREKIAGTHKSLIFLHHTNKISTNPIKSLENRLTNEDINNRIQKIQGGSQIIAAARFVCYLESAADDSYQKLLSVVKSNVGYTGDIIETLEIPHKQDDDIVPF